MSGQDDLVFHIKARKDQFDRTVAGTRGSLKSLVGLAKSALGGIAAAYSAAFSVQAHETQIKAERKLAAVLKSTGHAAGLTAKEIKDLAAARQGLTNFGNEGTIDASAILATFKEVKGSVFKETIGLAQDMSTVMDQDLKSSVVQLGKALNDPIVGLTALTRVGVSFTAQQKQQIRTLQESGDILGAQKVILAELRSEFGGAAEGTASSLEQMKNAAGDIAEEVGSLMNPVISLAALLMKGLSHAISATKREFMEFFDLGEKEAPALKKNFSDLADEFSDTGSAAGNMSALQDLIEHNRKLIAETEALKNKRDFGRIKGDELVRLAALVDADLEGRDESYFTELNEQITAAGYGTDKLKVKLTQLRELLETLPAGSAAREAVQREHDSVTGITAAIAAAKREFELASGKTPQDLLLEEFADRGVDRIKVGELGYLFKMTNRKKEENEQFAALEKDAGKFRDDLKTPFQEFETLTGRMSETFERGLLNPDEFQAALEMARADFESSIAVNPEKFDPGTITGPEKAFELGSSEASGLIAAALSGKSPEAKEQIKNLQEINEASQLSARANERIERLLREGQIETKEGP